MIDGFKDLNEYRKKSAVLLLILKTFKKKFIGFTSEDLTKK